MSRYIEYPLEDGSSVIIEIAEESSNGLMEAGIPGADKVLKVATQAFDKAIDGAYGSANLLLQKLRKLDKTPSEISITFGLKATGEIGSDKLVVAKTGGEANYTVTLKWEHDNKTA